VVRALFRGLNLAEAYGFHERLQSHNHINVMVHGEYSELANNMARVFIVSACGVASRSSNGVHGILAPSTKSYVYMYILLGLPRFA
jgi:hypothetical protein